MKNKLTKEEFIRRAREVHKDIYDYSNIEYKNYDTKVCIICPEHGEFWQTPGNHFKGKGCPVCSGNAKLTTEEFIKKGKEKWGNKFDYSKVKYINNTTKVCIIDENGNEFWQTPSNHLSGFDCSKVNIRKNTEDFIKNAKLVHGDKYDYSKVKYVNCKTKVCIICPEHGEFWQIPNNHLKGQGCNKCAIEKNHRLQRKNTEDFIKNAKIVHEDKYNYSKVEYKNNETKVCIICPEHGEFQQTPYVHLYGCGCPKCAGNIQLTTEEFIRRAKKVYKEYDYSKVEYKNNHTKVKIICPKHGEFEITPNSILSGHGCKFCGKNYRIQETLLYEKLKEYFSFEEIVHSYYEKEILGKQEIDIYFPKYKIGVEFQGIQHFKPTDFASYGYEKAKQVYKDNCKRDLKKLNICKKNSITLLYFSNIKEEIEFLGEKIYHEYSEIIEVINKIIKKENEK